MNEFEKVYIDADLHFHSMHSHPEGETTDRIVSFNDDVFGMHFNLHFADSQMVLMRKTEPLMQINFQAQDQQSEVGENTLLGLPAAFFVDHTKATKE